MTSWLHALGQSIMGQECVEEEALTPWWIGSRGRPCLTYPACQFGGSNSPMAPLSPHDFGQLSRKYILLVIQRRMCACGGGRAARSM
jgi:hypothetical protein